MGAIVLAGAAGFLLGAAIIYFFRIGQGKNAREIASELLRESETRRQSDIDTVIGHLKASFGDMSLEALTKSSSQLIELAKAELGAVGKMSASELGAKKGLIDQQLKNMATQLEGVSSMVKELEKDREQKFGELTSHLRTAGEQTQALARSTNSLREALASTRARGQWGERMAEDVLRMAGFIENVNYLKQKSSAEGDRPDFTFLLPKELKLNMDAKFPLDNYMRYLETEPGVEQEQYRKAFLRDVKARVKEVTTRNYINHADNTVDYVLLFIPNEQIYSFIHEQDSSILDEGLRRHVVFCSPITLFAVLAVIRQAVDNFSLEQTSNEILELLNMFRKQWGEFVKRLEMLGKKLEAAQKDYEMLTTTRQRQLERPLDKIEDLRLQRGLALAEPANAENAALEASLAAEQMDEPQPDDAALPAPEPLAP
ncbi:MAG: DNA recombination protein RmuC [Thermoleophilia bacterium]